jgi:hypothetical protein
MLKRIARRHTHTTPRANSGIFAMDEIPGSCQAKPFAQFIVNSGAASVQPGHLSSYYVAYAHGLWVFQFSFQFSNFFGAFFVTFFACFIADFAFFWSRSERARERSKE